MTQPRPWVQSSLIVEDYPPDADWCARVLRRTGCYGDTVVAGSADEALRVLCDYESTRSRYPRLLPPMVVFVDINLPGMDGFDFLSELQASQEALRAAGAFPSGIVMLTSSDHPRDRARAATAPLVSDYVVKPITPEDAMRLANRFGAATP